MDDETLVSQQIEYYRARAAEYDEWFLRQGRYDRGPSHQARWFGEAASIEASLKGTLEPAGRVLELACGTGLWTRHLARLHRRVVAVDTSFEAITINRERLRASNVSYVVADVFSWSPPPRAFDAVFFAFWLSHVPPRRFDEFWATVKRALKPGGRAFFVDSLLQQESTAKDHAPLDESGAVRRRLNDGREFEIVKVFYQPPLLEQRLSERGWQGWVRSSGEFFLYGSMMPEADSGELKADAKADAESGSL